LAEAESGAAASKAAATIVPMAAVVGVRTMMGTPDLESAGSSANDVPAAKRGNPHALCARCKQKKSRPEGRLDLR
jgi:hypothetical protein